MAPDESSKKSGKDLSNPSKWVSKGASDAALWGECQGSGSKPYQTQVDRANIAFKCSCPSRKFPCKHGIGLLLLHARQAASFTDTDMPAWVSEWINKRTEKQEKQVEKKEKPVDEAAQAKRQQARQSKVSDGAEELLLWIKDIVRNGLLTMPDKGADFFEGMARRMVDAQAPGLANIVRSLGDTNFYREGWQSDFLDQLLRIYLIITGYKNNEQLPEALQQDLRLFLGFTQNQEALKEQKGITDTWLIMGKQTNEEYTLTVERNWLYGINSNSYALILQFIVRGQGSSAIPLTPGLFIEAELVFYPSTIPLRAIIKKQINSSANATYQGFADWQAVVATEAHYSSLLPFRNERPYIIEQLRPVQYNQQWWLQDSTNHMMPIDSGFRNIWKLLSLSGGFPLNMAVVGKEKSFMPIGVWHHQNYKLL